MRTKGSPEWQEGVRRLAVARLAEGESTADVAELFGVHVATVRRWACTWRAGGDEALAAATPPGRPSKLTPAQAERVLGWVRGRSPTAFGFATELWTALRVAAVIERRMGVRFNHRYLNHWLAAHGITPQLPQRVPRERDDAAVARWVAVDWPAIKRGRPRPARPCFSPTKRAF